MNIFQSEDHVRRWVHFNPDSAESIMPVADWAIVQGTESRRHFLDSDYLSNWLPRRREERWEALQRLDGHPTRFVRAVLANRPRNASRQVRGHNVLEYETPSMRAGSLSEELEGITVLTNF